MKKNYSLLFLFSIISAALIIAVGCRKINEATDVGGDLIPAVDNINTFETFLNIESDNKIFTDTTEVYSTDLLGFGHIGSDPDFGVTHANAYFDISRAVFNVNPFVHKDSVVAIDSVVLSLSYDSYYGDSLSFQTVRVFEIDQNSAFRDTSRYKFSQPDFTTAGGQLGAKTFQIKSLKDTITHIRKRDTTKLVNVIRIRLDNSFGVRLSQYDTTNTANGGYRSDSLFKKLFKGFAIKSDNSGNAITYTNAGDLAKTGLVVYCRIKNAGVIDTTSVVFNHFGGRLSYASSNTFTVGQANTITRTPGGGWATYLGNSGTNEDLVYLQSTPGSYALLKIPALDTFRNAVVHRAEIIASPVPAIPNKQFSFPGALILDRISTAGDTAFTFDKDMSIVSLNPFASANSFTYDFRGFGGALKTDSTYRFNISRHVQEILTKQRSNGTLRIYAPLRTFLYSEALKYSNQVFVNSIAAFGRIVLTGGSYPDASRKMRLRIVYSKL